MIYVTGDTHGDFNRIKAFCEEFNTTKEDIMNHMKEEASKRLKNS